MRKREGVTKNVRAYKRNANGQGWRYKLTKPSKKRHNDKGR